MDQTHHFSPADLDLFRKKGISESQISQQLDYFRTGFPYLTLQGYATTGNGIVSVNDCRRDYYINCWEKFLKKNGSICKFVPASGAASRMFKDLFEYLETSDNVHHSPFVEDFFRGIDRFAFYKSLNDNCIQILGLTLNECIAQAKEKEVIDVFLRKGLRYGNLPKGVLEFHRYEHGDTRTPMEEHLVEGALYAKDKNGVVRIHFTVSEEFIGEFEMLIRDKVPAYESKFGVHYEISFSYQKPSTDTIAVDSNNQPFRESSGEIVFRPGGHGALIENLNDLTDDVVFIKNIDNVVPDHFKNDTVLYKQVIAGLLVDIRKRVFEHLSRLDSMAHDDSDLIEDITRFLENDLFIKLPNTFEAMASSDQVKYLRSKLNRPIRVCGVVRNSGEPGGGPYWVENPDRSVSLQILESSQIDIENEQSARMLKESTHFNPVDLVCSTKNYNGKSFDLKEYIDAQTSFISSKSKSGKVLKALELPGLWNGAMAHWITLLVEVPLSTFNPVKTVNDLLRKEHQ